MLKTNPVKVVLIIELSKPIMITIRYNRVIANAGPGFLPGPHEQNPVKAIDPSGWCCHSWWWIRDALDTLWSVPGYSEASCSGLLTTSDKKTTPVVTGMVNISSDCG